MSDTSVYVGSKTGLAPAVVPTADAAPDWFDWLLRAAIVLALAAIVFVTFRGRVFEPLLQSAANSDWASVVIRPSVIWILMGTLLLVFRTALWFSGSAFITRR